MGMAASQARLLSMTARISNNEFEQQAIAYSKQRLADDSSRVNDAYLEALNKTQFQVLTGYNGAEACYEDLTYNQITGCNKIANGKQYIVKNNKGKVLVSEAIAEAFEKNNGDYNKFLRDLGYRQANINVKNHTESVEAIHEAWDKYLNTVGKSINDADNQHILGFGYTSFGDESFNGYPTYNTATGTDSTGKAYSLYKDEQGYYLTNSVVVPKKNDDGKYECYYQTPEQYGTDEYNKLEDITYDDKTKKFTYKNSDGTTKQVDVLYATQTDAGNAYVSENEKNFLTLKDEDSNLYQSENGIYYTVKDKFKALNFEGTTQAQRELYDYALALTEAYYDRANSNTTGNPNLKYDAEQINYYKNIFNEMRTCGFTTLKKSYAQKLIREEDVNKSSNEDLFTGEHTMFNDAKWFVTQLKAGALTISYYSAAEKSFIGSSLYDDESITEKEDKAAIAIAEQEYNSHMDRIERQDKEFDMQMNKLESEHNALQTEYESVAKIISKNVETSYKTFSA